MAKPSLMARVEALEAKRAEGEGIVFVGRYERNKDGSLTVFSDTSRNCLDGGKPECVLEVVPKQRAAQWLKDLIVLKRSYGDQANGN